RAGEGTKRHCNGERPAEFLDQVRCARSLLGEIRSFRLCFELLEAGIRVEIALEPGKRRRIDEPYTNRLENVVAFEETLDDGQVGPDLGLEDTAFRFEHTDYFPSASAERDRV